MPATDTGETSGRRSISRPRFLSPKSKHSNISADRESLNQLYNILAYILYQATLRIFKLIGEFSTKYRHIWQKINKLKIK